MISILVTVGLLLLSAPSSAHSMMTSASKRFVAPFHGVSWQLAGSKVRGCSNVTTATQPFFHLYSGVGGVRSNASSRSCATSSNNLAIVDPVFGATIVLPYVSGVPTIALNLTVNFSLSGAILPGQCQAITGFWKASCTIEAYVGLVVQVQVVNVSSSNSSVVAGEWNSTVASLINQTTCYSGNCTSSVGGATSFGPRTVNGSDTIRYTFPAPLNKSRKYAVALVIIPEVSAVASSYHASLLHAHAWAKLRMAFGGEGVRLNSIVET